MVYNGNYLNGRSSQLYPCRIEFLRGQVRISIRQDSGEDATIAWNPLLLHPVISSSQNRHTLTYGEFPYQSLIIEDANLPLMLKTLYPDLGLSTSDKQVLSGRNVPILLGIVAGFIGLAALTYWVLLTWGADLMAQHIPVETEIQLGEGVYTSYVEAYTINRKASDDLNKFLWQLADTTEYPVRTTVVQSDVINAFALPGGHIVVFDSIIKSMESYEELAALMGHEYSHVKLRHSTRSLLRNLSSLLFVSLVVGDVSSIISVAAENANTLNNLQYSRKFEEDADTEGMRLMKAKHINLTGMLHLFETLKSAGGGADIPDFLSTHPATDNRIAHVKAEIKQQQDTVKNKDLQQLFEQIKKDIAEKESNK